MKRIVVRLSGMPFDPTYEIDDDTVAIGDMGPSARQQFSFHRGRRGWNGHRPGKLLYRAMQACHPSQVTAYQQELPTVFTSLASRLRGAAKLIPGAAMYHWTLLSGPGRAAVTRRGVQPGGVDWTAAA